jgi:hypothetical protein
LHNRHILVLASQTPTESIGQLLKLGLFRPKAQPALQLSPAAKHQAAQQQQQWTNNCISRQALAEIPSSL